MDTIAQVSWMSVSGKFYSLSIININFVSAYFKSLSGMHELVLASELLLKGCVGFLCACANTYIYWFVQFIHPMAWIYFCF